jgi:antitoxin component YwqK of YwqJK toxin-antitoxin module/predicted esterase
MNAKVFKTIIPAGEQRTVLLLRLKKEVNNMKKLLILTLILVFVWGLNLAREKEKIIQLEGDKEKKITYYQNGSKKDEYEYQKGKKHGKYTKWYQSGEKEEQGEIFEDKDHGTITRWYKDGKIYGKGTFAKGTGQWAEYYPGGKKKTTAAYKDGKLHGKLVEWYENDAISYELEFKEGKRHGLWSSRDKEGNKFSETKYEEDKKVWENEELIAQARAKIKVEYEIVKPGNFSPKKKYPLLLLLHGRGGNLKSSQERWKTKDLSSRFLIAFVQSSQFLSFIDCYSWDDLQQSRQDVRLVYKEISENYPVDKDKIIIAGMSAGGKISIDAALNGIVPAAGFIACCPPKPEGLTKEMVQKSAARGIRGTIIAGENDTRWVGGAREMAAMFEEMKLPHRLIIVPGMGHQVPEDSDRLLKEAIEHIF